MMMLPAESDYAAALRGELLSPHDKPSHRVTARPWTASGSVWGLGGTGGKTDGSGFGTAPPHLSDFWGNRNLHGYFVVGSNEPDLVGTPYGVGIARDGAATAYGSLWLDNQPLGHDSDATFFVAAYLATLPAKAVLAGLFNGAMTPLRRYGVGIHIESGHVYASRSSNNSNQYVRLPLPDGDLVVAAASFRGNRCELTVNGVVAVGTVATAGHEYDFGLGESGHAAHSNTARARVDGAILGAGMVPQALSGGQLKALTDDFWREVTASANDSPFLIPAAVGGAVIHTETLDGALSSGGDFQVVGDSTIHLDGVLQSGGDLLPLSDYRLSLDGHLQGAGDLPDVFDRGPVTFTETLDGALVSSGALAAVMTYAMDVAGSMQSGGDLIDTFQGAGLFEELLDGALQSGGDLSSTYESHDQLTGALTTGGDLIPVLESSITTIGHLSSGGDLVVMLAYVESIAGALQSGGDLTDAFSAGSADFQETLDGGVLVGGDLVPVVQWGVLLDGQLQIGGDLLEVSDVFDCTQPPTYTAFDRARDRLNASILKRFGETVTFPALGLSVTAVLVHKDGEVPAGNARPGVPRDELRIKESDICHHPIDHGTEVSVRGVTYRVTSKNPGIHGMTTLSIRRVH